MSSWWKGQVGILESFFKLSIYFICTIIALQYCDGFAMNQPQVYMLNPPHTSFPNPIPLGWPRALALGALPHAANLHWPSVFHMVMCMFQCYSLTSFIRVLISFLRAPASWPNHLTKSSPPNTITLGISVLKYEFGECTNTQSVAKIWNVNSIMAQILPGLIMFLSVAYRTVLGLE